MNMVQNPFARWDDKGDPEVPTGTLQLYQHISKVLSERKDSRILRASMAGYCVRRRQWTRMGEKGTPLTPRKIINFLLGNLTEQTIKYFIEQACVGPGKLYKEAHFGGVVGCFPFDGYEIKLYDQEEWSFKIEKGSDSPLVVTAHPDGWAIRNTDGKAEIIEIKSSSNWGFKSFRDENKCDYLEQATAMMMTDEAKRLGINETRFWYLRKETGHPWDSVYRFDEDMAKKVIENYKRAESDAIVPRPYGLVPEMEGRAPNKKKTGRFLAQFPCTYCPFIEKCFGEARIEWKKDQHKNFRPVQVYDKDAK